MALLGHKPPPEPSPEELERRRIIRCRLIGARYELEQSLIQAREDELVGLADRVQDALWALEAAVQAL